MHEKGEVALVVIELCERTDRQIDKSNGTMRHVRSGLNTASDGRALRDLDLAAATQQHRPLARRG